MFYNIVILISYPYQHIVEKIIGYLLEKILMSNHQKISQRSRPQKNIIVLHMYIVYIIRLNIISFLNVLNKQLII